MTDITNVADIFGRYTLAKVNDNTPDTSTPVHMEIQADPDDHTRAHMQTRVANSMNGTVRFEFGLLKGSLQSTRMMGRPGQMVVERIISGGLREGMRISREGNNIKMCAGSDSLLWNRETR